MAETQQAAARPSVPELDRILGLPYKVLDDGFVRVIDYMGSDEAIVQAARVSYGSGTKRVSEDRGLIRYLMRHSHTTPFEMCEIKLHVRVPMDAWRQWIRHRTANVNEYSTRYSIAIDAAQQTAPDEWRLQSMSNQQGSSGTLSAAAGTTLSERERELQVLSRQIYEERISLGVAREQARKDLPLSTYTEAYWKIDLHNLFHFLHLRSDPHAQVEIRRYAQAIGDKIVRKWCPLAWEAFQEFRVDALNLSHNEVAILAALAAGDVSRALELAQAAGWLNARASGDLRPNRERTDCEAKLSRLGYTAPWRPMPATTNGAIRSDDS